MDFLIMGFMGNSAKYVFFWSIAIMEAKYYRFLDGKFWHTWFLKLSKFKLRSVILLPLTFSLGSEALAENSVPIRLKAKNGSTYISGDLLRISDDHYYVKTGILGAIKIKVSNFECYGVVCPELTETVLLKAKLEAKANLQIVTISTKNENSTPGQFLVSEAESKTQRLLALIAVAEATYRGYDTVQLRARVSPPAPPTQLTLGQIRKWVRSTPRQQHAIGRYQFIPKTFNSLQRRLGLPDSTVFSPNVQDRMALILLKDAGYDNFLAGEMHPNKFMDSLASIWAGLPLQSGRSKYHGYAGNKASITRAFFANNVSAIFKDQSARGRRG